MVAGARQRRRFIHGARASPRDGQHGPVPQVGLNGSGRVGPRRWTPRETRRRPRRRLCRPWCDPREEEAGTGAAADVDDVRVLPDHFERDGRRFRRLHGAEPDAEEELFDDWPLDGERSLARGAGELRRDDRRLQHHAEWAKISGVRVNDRSMHEHKAPGSALHHFTCFLTVSGSLSAHLWNEFKVFTGAGVGPAAVFWSLGRRCGAR